MAIADQLGTTLAVGAGTITGSYILERDESNGKDVDFEDIHDEDGALKTRLIFKKHAKRRLQLICIDGAAPETDFVVGACATHTDFTSWYVDDATIEKTKSAHRVSVEMTNLGIT